MKMVRRKICRGGFLLGYWKGERVALIPQYHPKAKPGEYIVEEVEFPIDYPIPRIIDPTETPLSEIKEICEFNNFPFSWIVDTGAKAQDTIKIHGNSPIQNAIEYFIALRTAGTTMVQYRRIFDDLIQAGVIDPLASLDDYLQRANTVEESALKFSSLGPHSSKYYNYNDKTYNMLRSFHAFLKNPQGFRMKKTRKGNKFYRVKRKNCLTEEEAKTFFPALKEINSAHELIARILWWFNHEICNHPDAPIIHLESVLLMQASDIGPDSLKDIRDRLPDNVGGNSVCVRSRAFPGSKMVCYYVPGPMYAELSELARTTDVFLFRNKSGGPIDPRMVRRSFARACEQANLRNITPNQLR